MNKVAERSLRNDQEERLRIQVAACVRLLHMQKILSYNGHVSTRLPGRDALMIHSLVESRAEVAPASLLVVDFDGRVLDGEEGVKPPSEVFIHSEIYRARPDVNAVAHVHSENALALTLVKGGKMHLMRCDSVRWRSGIPVHPDPSRIRTPEQGRELAATLGPHNAALMRAHGGLLVAETIPSVLAAAIQFEENARAQMLAATAGEIQPLTKLELDELSKSSPPEFMAHYASKIWKYYVQEGIAVGIIPESWKPELN
ncbi:MAG: class II aldolase/adducin family protein [Rhodospirillales bacterium]|nr:class II aldolase/adducin family protein [Rhodospirillales bacterium]